MTERGILEGTKIKCILINTFNGIRTGSGPEKTGLFMQIEVRTLQIKNRTQTGPQDPFLKTD